MFASDQGSSGRTHAPPRPLIVGLLLLLSFLVISRNHGGAQTGSAVRGGVRTGDLTEGVKEKIIYDLSLDNERLSRDLLQLKQYVLDMRRAARGCGCALNDTVLTIYPELHTRITEAEVAAAAAAAAQQNVAGDTAPFGGAAHDTSGDAQVALNAAGAAAATGQAAGGALAAGARRLVAAQAVSSRQSSNSSGPEAG